MKKGVILLGSSNSYGETYQAAKLVSDQTAYPIIDLKTKNIGQFDYEFNNQEDDFMPLMHKIVDNYDLLIFATPVYWYTMSGIMKKFFDRISDCLKIAKPTGRKLRGKSMAVISSGSEEALVGGFYMPFVESAKYLGMHYMGEVHSWVEEEQLPVVVQERLIHFSTLIHTS